MTCDSHAALFSFVTSWQFAVPLPVCFLLLCTVEYRLLGGSSVASKQSSSSHVAVHLYHPATRLVDKKVQWLLRLPTLNFVHLPYSSSLFSCVGRFSRSCCALLLLSLLSREFLSTVMCKSVVVSFIIALCYLFCHVFISCCNCKEKKRARFCLTTIMAFFLTFLELLKKNTRGPLASASDPLRSSD